MDWKAGDLGIKLKPSQNMCPNRARHQANQRARQRFDPSPGIAPGTICRVSALVDRMGEVGLALEGYPHSYCAGGFRKVQPYQERYAEQLRSALPAKEVA